MIILIAILVVVGSSLVVLGLRELAPQGRFLKRKRMAAAQVREGFVEVAGTIAPDDAEPVTSLGRTPCVVVQTIHEQRVGKNMYREIGRETSVVKAVLTDPSGTCAVSLSHVEIMGETWQLLVGGQRTTQIVIPVGARVVVSGRASLSDHRGEGGYRGGERRAVVAGDEAAPLLVAIGGQAGSILRYAWPAVFAVACGVALLGLAAVAATMRSMLGT